MKKLKKINIKYFQTHENTDLTFSDGITVLVGKTDSGKTAIIRSLKLITKNKPRGNGFISAFAPSDKKNKPTTKITLTLDDDTQIERTKSENKNEYIIRTSESEEAYNNFGVNIPPEVEDIIGSMSVKVDKDTSLDVNIAEQLSQPFLLFESPLVKTKLIDKIARIDVLNKAIKNTKLQEIDIKNRQKEIKQNIDSIENKLKEFENLETEKENLEHLKTLYQSYIDKKQKLERYNELLNTLNEIDNDIVKYKNAKSILQNFITVAEEKLTSSKNNYKLYLSLTLHYTSLSNANKEITYLQSLLSQKEIVDKLTVQIAQIKDKINKYLLLYSLYSKCSNLSREQATEKDLVARYKMILPYEKKVTELKNKVIALQRFLDLYSNLNNLNSSINTANIFIPEQKQKLNDAVNELNSIYQTLKVCPVCKRPFDGHYHN